MRTFSQKTAETQHDWYVVDAAGQRLGTLAVRIARALSGKHKPTWTPHIDDGDHVIVLNADKVELGGNKWTQKLYHRHSRYPGGLRTETAPASARQAPRAPRRARRARHAPHEPHARRTSSRGSKCTSAPITRTRRKQPAPLA